MSGHVHVMSCFYPAHTTCTRIVSGTLSELLDIDFGDPLHTLVIPGDMHYIELDMYEHYHWNRAIRTIQKQKQVEEEQMRKEEEYKKRREEEKQRQQEAKEQFQAKKKAQQQATATATTTSTPASTSTRREESDDEEVVALTDDISLF